MKNTKRKEKKQYNKNTNMVNIKPVHFIVINTNYTTGLRMDPSWSEVNKYININNVR